MSKLEKIFKTWNTLIAQQVEYRRTEKKTVSVAFLLSAGLHVFLIYLFIVFLAMGQLPAIGQAYNPIISISPYTPQQSGIRVQAMVQYTQPTSEVKKSKLPGLPNASPDQPTLYGVPKTMEDIYAPVVADDDILGFGASSKYDGIATSLLPEGSPFGVPGGKPDGHLPEGDPFASGEGGSSYYGGAVAVSKAERPPIPLIQPEPEYPPVAKQARIEGKVILQIVVDTKGDVTNIKVKKSMGHTGMDEAAIKAVTQWKFKPAMTNNKPVAVFIDVTINFKLE
jgi:TonB family protein